MDTIVPRDIYETRQKIALSRGFTCIASAQHREHVIRHHDNVTCIKKIKLPAHLAGMEDPLLVVAEKRVIQAAGTRLARYVTGNLYIPCYKFISRAHRALGLQLGRSHNKVAAGETIGVLDRIKKIIGFISKII